MSDRQSRLVRTASENPDIVGPYSTWVAEEGERECAERGRGEVLYAHERGMVPGQLKDIAAKHGVSLEPLVKAFYVGRYSGQEDDE